MAELDLTSERLFIATPMYGGMASAAYIESLIETIQVLPAHGVMVQYGFLTTDSLITRARNTLSDFFINKTDCTRVMWIDADERWHAGDILAMLRLDKDIIGAPYPKKQIYWPHVVAALAKGEQSPEVLAECGSRFNFNIIRSGETKRRLVMNEPWEVSEVGTGFMMVKRGVFDKMREQYPLIRYRPYNEENSHEMWAYFDTMVDRETGHYCSEDYTFCRRWTDAGGSIWLCPWIVVNHIGQYEYPGKVETVLTKVGKFK